MKKTYISLLAGLLAASSFMSITMVFADTQSSSTPQDEVKTSSTIVATSSAAIIPPPGLAVSACVKINKNIGFGMRDTRADVQITALQNFLKDAGYFGLGATGYYGPLTRNAVKQLQKDNGIEGTGFVGPKTLALIKKLTCTPKSDSPIAVVTPNGGESWSLNSLQSISWKYVNTVFSGEDKLDIMLEPTYPSCTQGKPCPMLMMVKPYTLATSTPANAGQFNWAVGSTLDENRAITPGTYRIQICVTRTSVCDESDNPFTITP